MLRGLAHELRNPLAPIRLAIETMRSSGTDNATMKAAQEVIDRQTAHMTRLVDDLLDVARITQGKITLQKEPTALASVIEQAVELSRPLMVEGQRFTVVQPPTPIYVESDPVRLAQVVANLLQNAAKFTPKSGEITLLTLIADKDALIKVSDSGEGIQPELLPHVFDMFVQGDHLPARRHGGMGLGLTLARRIVELHGGTIEAKSEGEGKGSEFLVRLPRLEKLEEARVRPGAAVREGARAAATARRRVLVVDDNVDAATTMQTFLEMQGHEARCAFDGPSGLRLAREFPPDLVLLDIAMPGMDGYEVLRRLRELPGAQPVVAALTGFGPGPECERMKQTGFDHHLVKPVDPRPSRRSSPRSDSGGIN